MRKIFVSRIYHALPSYAKRNGTVGGFHFDDNVWLVANWRQGVLTIGSTPDPGELHLTQGVLWVVGGLILDFLLFICTYFPLYLYVCPRSTSILYSITHTFIAYIRARHA